MIAFNWVKLFSIQLLHDAYRHNDDILQDIDITLPGQSLKAIQANYLQYKLVGNTILCYAQTVAAVDTLAASTSIVTENKPLAGFSESTEICFNLNIVSSRFLDKSNLRFCDLRNKVYAFCNDSANRQVNTLYLSRKLPLYNATATYKPGMLVFDSARGKTFEAIQPSSAANAHGTGDNAFWNELASTVQYVSQNDLVDDTDNVNCFATIKILFDKTLPANYSLLKKSVIAAEDNLILGRDYIVHFKSAD